MLKKNKEPNPQVDAVKAKVGKRWNSLDSKQRMLLLTAGAIAIVCSGGLILGNSKVDQREEKALLSSERRIVNESDLLEETMLESVNRKTSDVEAEQALIRQELTDIGKAIASMQESGGSIDPETLQALARSAAQEAVSNHSSDDPARPTSPPPRPEPTGQGYEPMGRVASYPAPPIQGTPRAAPLGLTSADAAEPRILGGMTSMPSAGVIDLSPKTGAGEESVYLSPGFMNATLLTGVDALASGTGTDNPEPLLFRVQTPAVLPNYVRANLQGCFVIGNATGSLAKERVEVQAVTLSCIDFDERSVIEEPIKGFLVDTDGKKGLSGKVVTKAGALVGRAFLGGLVDGLGEGVQTAAGSRAVSPLGQVQTYGAEDVAQAGIGAGFSNGGQLLSEYYLELADQTKPVIEVGAAKDVVLVIQEGVDLRIRRDVNVVR